MCVTHSAQNGHHNFNNSINDRFYVSPAQLTHDFMLHYFHASNTWKFRVKDSSESYYAYKTWDGKQI